MACIGILSPRRQEILLYLAVSILTMTIVNIVITEYWFYSTDMSKILKKYSNHVIIEYGKTIIYHNYFTWSISFSFSTTFNYCLLARYLQSRLACVGCAGNFLVLSTLPFFGWVPTTDTSCEWQLWYGVLSFPTYTSAIYYSFQHK